MHRFGRPYKQALTVFHWEDIEEEAERIIADLVPEGLNDPSRLRPYPFAERLGLKIVSLPLYKRPKTASILFFGPGEVLTDSDADAPPVSVAVEANTIVLDSHAAGRWRSGEAPGQKEIQRGTGQIRRQASGRADACSRNRSPQAVF